MFNAIIIYRSIHNFKNLGGGGQMPHIIPTPQMVMQWKIAELGQPYQNFGISWHPEIIPGTFLENFLITNCYCIMNSKPEYII